MRRDCRGATSVEYVLALVAVLLVVAVAYQALGDKSVRAANDADVVLGGGTAAERAGGGGPATPGGGAAPPGGAAAPPGGRVATGLVTGESIERATVRTSVVPAPGAPARANATRAMGLRILKADGRADPGSAVAHQGISGTATFAALLPRGRDVTELGDGFTLVVNPVEQLVPSGPTFGNIARGTAPQPIDGALAKIASDVYKDGTAPVDGWSRLTAAQLEEMGISPGSLIDPTTGLRAAIYTDGNGSYVLAFAGTDPWSIADWRTNLAQGLGLESAQYNQAVALAKEAKAIFGDNLVLTGHSLGGGLASAAALATGSPAVTFNSAGLSDATLEQIGLDPAAARAEASSGEIRRYVVQGEALANFQEGSFVSRGLVPQPVGTQVSIADPKPLSWWSSFIPGASALHAVYLHGTDAVNASLEQNPPWEPRGGEAVYTSPATGWVCDATSCRRGPGQCFVAGTEVLTPRGPRPIDQIVPGDAVLSRDEETGVVSTRAVLRTFIRPATGLVDVRMARDGEPAATVRGTAGHPYWTLASGWMRADALAAGDVLLDDRGAEIHVLGVESHGGEELVYNLEVEGTHTYFVGPDGAWVHNAGNLAFLPPPQLPADPAQWTPAQTASLASYLHDRFYGSDPRRHQGVTVAVGVYAMPNGGVQVVASVSGDSWGGANVDPETILGYDARGKSQLGTLPPPDMRAYLDQNGWTYTRENFHAETGLATFANVERATPLTAGVSRPFCATGICENLMSESFGLSHVGVRQVVPSPAQIHAEADAAAAGGAGGGGGQACN